MTERGFIIISGIDSNSIKPKCFPTPEVPTMQIWMCWEKFHFTTWETDHSNSPFPLAAWTGTGQHQWHKRRLSNMLFCLFQIGGHVKVGGGGEERNQRNKPSVTIGASQQYSTGQCWRGRQRVRCSHHFSYYPPTSPVTGLVPALSPVVMCDIL